MTDFAAQVSQSYTFKGASILVGGAINKGEPVVGLQIRIPLKTLNRHGLVAGATGTGKTKSLQVLLEELSMAGVPSLVMDMKGDLSGIGAPGEHNQIIAKREELIAMKWQAAGFPIEFLSISEQPGTRIRSTVSEFGPVILSKILGLNDTQAGLLGMLFMFADKKKLPLLNLADLKALLRFATEDGKAELSSEYGLVSTTSAQAIMREIASLEQQGGAALFGEPSFDVFDLCSFDPSGRGKINIIRLMDIQAKPDLFSAFMLSLMAEVFEVFPEAGDSDKPKLMLFIDEAHLLFRGASKELLDQMDVIIKLIRSKGIGIVFITQDPGDIPENILGQLGFKLQHALRAFTAKDRTALKLSAQNFPISDFYDTETLLTEMGIGEALLTALDEKGRPTELVHTLMRPPFSRMDVLTPVEINMILQYSALAGKYNKEIDSVSAHEILVQRINANQAAAEETEDEPEAAAPRTTSTKQEPSTFEQVMKSPVTNTIVRELTRGILGIFGISTAARRSSVRRRR